MHITTRSYTLSVVIVVVLAGRSTAQLTPSEVPGTQRLEMEGEIDRHLVAGVSKFLDRKLEESATVRHQQVQAHDSSSWQDALVRHRERLRHILGMRDSRPEQPSVELVATLNQPAKVASCEHFDVFAVRWRAFGKVHAEGLMLKPRTVIKANVVAIPDADQTPEQLIGLQPGTAVSSRYPIELASNGCQVLIPALVSRQRNQFAWHGRRVDVTNRELLYRPAFLLGRHLIGYEVQKVLAGVDWFSVEDPALPVGVVGWGEGGAMALFSGALDDRIQTTCVSGYFEPREKVWQQPIDRNVFGLLEHFGDAELAAMVAPRGLIVEASNTPQVELSGGAGAPGRLSTPEMSAVRGEFEKSKSIANQLGRSTENWNFTSSGDQGRGPAFCDQTRSMLLAAIVGQGTAKLAVGEVDLQDARKSFDANNRLHRQMQQLDDHSQHLLRESRFVRDEYMKGLKVKTLGEYEAALPEYRQRFARDVIGQFDIPLLPANARTRKSHESEKWVGYEVVLDVFPDVIAYGLLLLPRDLKQDEKRPVVVCQHGLEGRPQDVIGEDSHHYYKAFAAKLAERGFITFAPQNLYRHRDEFRVLQRKANPLGKTLFSIITPQHQQIIKWLKTQPNVDPERIGFYGLSYGGKTAMRVPALLPDYCLSICSADFNEWVDKNASTRNPRSYVWSGEYEIFEWDLGSTFNYAEMAALIAPRPFMVERGHDDGVSADETVAYEFAKVRHRYVKLGIGDRCEIEWFNGPHTINGKGTYDFLHRHLNWSKPSN